MLLYLVNIMITGDLSAQCHYCTHYSSAIIVASYLVRMEPFSQTFLQLQVNFSPVWPDSNTSHYCCYRAHSATETEINNVCWPLLYQMKHKTCLCDRTSPIKLNFSKLNLLDETSFIVFGLVWACVRFLFFLSKTELGYDFNMYANKFFCVTCLQNHILFLKHISFIHMEPID